MKNVCDDFINSFKDTTDFEGVFFDLIHMGIDDPIFRPEGLDYDYPGVKEIIERLANYKKEKSVQKMLDNWCKE